MGIITPLNFKNIVMSNDQTSREESANDETQVSTTEQSDKDSVIEVNGQTFTPDKLAESYKSLQSEFTKKSQKLKELEKESTKPDLSEDDK